MSQEDPWGAEVAERYDTPGAGMFADEVVGPAVDRLAELAGLERVLELAIGTGRLAVPLAARGVRVTGIELSRPMVDQLRTKADEAAIPVVIGDMVTARVEGEFGLVYLVYNTISNLLTQAAQVECFRNAARHLRPGGRFVVELWVPELRTLPPGQQATVWRADPACIGLDTYDVLEQQVVSHHLQFGEGTQAHLLRSRHRYVWPAELDLMAQLAGFELETRTADWRGAEFSAESRSHVSVYRLAEPPAVQPLVTDLEHLGGADGYREFLRVPALSLGLFAVGPGYGDSQQPHRHDEVYVVAAGRAVLLVDSERTEVSAGTVAYVPAGLPHRFLEVTEDLRVFVVFAPPGPE